MSLSTTIPSPADLDGDHDDQVPMVPPMRPPRRWKRFAGTAIALGVTGLVVGQVLDSGTAERRPRSAAAATSIDALRARTVAAPKSVKAWLAFGKAAMDQAVITGESSWYADSERALATAAKLAPKQADVLATQAALTLSKHQFAAAVPLAERAADTDPFSGAALASLVDAYVETGDLDRAAKTVETMLHNAPGAAASARLSYIRQLRGDMEGARLAMQQAVGAVPPGPDRANVSTYLGDLSMESGLLDDAERAYQRALTDSPKQVTAAVGLARVRAARGDLAGAAAEADRLIASSGHPAAALLRAELAVLTGDTVARDDARNHALAAFRKEQAIGVDLDLESANLESDTGDPSLALRIARRGYATRQTVFTIEALGWALLRNGHAAEALPYFDRAIAIGAGSPAIHLHAAAARQAVGDVAGARAALDRAFDSAPWMRFSLIPLAREVAGELGVELPAAWRIQAGG